MIITKTLCDKCKKEINVLKGDVVINVYPPKDEGMLFEGLETLNVTLYQSHPQKYDICQDCQAPFIEVIKQNII